MKFTPKVQFVQTKGTKKVVFMYLKVLDFSLRTFEKRLFHFKRRMTQNEIKRNKTNLTN